MAGKGGPKFDHVVSVMFENRTFDNLLGRLYRPGEVASFEGVIGRDLTNPIPEWAGRGADRKAVSYGTAAGMDTPNPDPGEEFAHVNTQLFGLIDPPGNRGVLAEQMAAPFNAPADPRAVPAMDGFVADYISAFIAQMGRQPRYEEYAQIMAGHTTEQVPVIWGSSWPRARACSVRPSPRCGGSAAGSAVVAWRSARCPRSGALTGTGGWRYFPADRSGEPGSRRC
jgi:phospholipase C